MKIDYLYNKQKYSHAKAQRGKDVAKRNNTRVGFFASRRPCLITSLWPEWFRLRLSRSLTLSVICFIALAGASVPSFAQETVKARQDSIEKAVEHELKKKQSDVKIFLDKIEILGRIEKPQTVFIVPGQNPVVDDIQIDRSFFKEIFRSIEVDQIRKATEKIERQRRFR